MCAKRRACRASTDHAHLTGFYYVYFQSDGFLVPQVDPLYVTNTVLPAIADSLSYSPSSSSLLLSSLELSATQVYEPYTRALAPFHSTVLSVCLGSPIW